MPAIIGTSRSSWCWLPLSAAPAPARITSGSTKLKNAALGLRQNILRSSRYWRQVRASPSGILVPGRCGGELEVDVLERRAAHRQLLQSLPTRERRGGELGQQRRGVVRL